MCLGMLLHTHYIIITSSPNVVLHLVTCSYRLFPFPPPSLPLLSSSSSSPPSSAGGDIVMEFRFNTDMETARRVVTSWNMAVLQSMADDPDKLNMISSFIQGSMCGTGGGGGGGGGGISDRGGRGTSLHRGIFGSSTRQKAKPTADKEARGWSLCGLSVSLTVQLLPSLSVHPCITCVCVDACLYHNFSPSLSLSSTVRRAYSLTEKTNHATLRRSTSPEVHPVPGNRLSSASQDSYTINAVTSSDVDGLTSPPPVPPRAPRKTWGLSADNSKSHEDDPDYSYIKDDEVEVGGGSGSQVSDGVVERQLDDLLRDILEDNNRKKQIADRQNHRILPAGEPPPIPRSRTFGHAGGTDYLAKARRYFEDYGDNKEPGDYLEPVPSKNPPLTQQVQRVSHAHSLSFPSSQQGFESDPQPKPPRSPTKHYIRENGTKMPTHPTPPPPPHTRHRSGSGYTPPGHTPPRPFSTSDNPPSPPLPPLPAHPPYAITTAATAEKTSPVQSTSSKADISPYAQTSNLRIGLGIGPKPATDSTSDTTLHLSPSSPPPLPPRSPIKQPRDRYHSTSSTTSSNSSLNHRCPRCKGMKHPTKRLVSKTVSLNDPHHTKAHHAAGSSSDIPRGSLPDLHHTSPIPENILGKQGRSEGSESSSTHSSNDMDVHTSSQSVGSSRGGDKYSPKRLSTDERRFSSTRSPTSPPSYLQVVEDQAHPAAKEGERALESTLEMLNSVVRDLENLETQVSENSSPGNPPPLKRTQELRPTDLDAAIKQVQQIQSDLTQAKQEPKKPMDRGLQGSSSIIKPPSSTVPSGTRHQRPMTIHHSNNSIPSSRPGTHHRSNSHHLLNSTTSVAVYNTAPHVPPRSAVSLQQQLQHYPHRPVNKQISSPAMSTGKQNDFAQCHRYPIPRHHSQGGRFESETVFFHHLQDIKRTQC